MAVGWTKDGAVQDQIDASLEDAVKKIRSNMNSGESSMLCKACGAAIPEARREALPGVQFCINCQSIFERSF